MLSFVCFLVIALFIAASLLYQQSHYHQEKEEHHEHQHEGGGEELNDEADGEVGVVVFGKSDYPVADNETNSYSGNNDMSDMVH